ncbi:hypothetical protein ACRQ5Q_42865 (plasmid) [Bradyrhizobium sp. PMVTL-01]|uniref:hypothetical protein n=1 Tax=Bradyrhizobium sp. PMVTL-01 TaxID=3434999 RepID=UPI003F71C055
MIEVREIETREIEVRDLTDTEIESVCGGVADLGKYITKAVDDAISSAIGGNPGVTAGGWPAVRPVTSP